MEAPRPALAVSTYGSDKDGLACSYLFGLPQAGRTIDAEEAVAWLRAPAPASAFLWLHFNVSNAAADRFR